MTEELSSTLEEDTAAMLAAAAESGFYESCGPLPFEQIKSILGPSPVLSTEDIQAYNDMLCHYMKSVGPKDFLHQMLVKDLADADWESLRIKRHKAWAIERRNQAALELEARRIKVIEDKRAEETQYEKPKTENERLSELECDVESLSVEAVKAADGFYKTSQDIVLSHAMEHAINYYERLDKLEKDSLTKRVILLNQIRQYEEAFLEKRRQRADYFDENERNRLRNTILHLRERLREP
jgi:hypothetical protein